MTQLLVVLHLWTIHVATFKRFLNKNKFKKELHNETKIAFGKKTEQGMKRRGDFCEFSSLSNSPCIDTLLFPTMLNIHALRDNCR